MNTNPFQPSTVAGSLMVAGLLSWHVAQSAYMSGLVYWQAGGPMWTMDRHTGRHVAPAVPQLQNLNR